MVLVAKEYSYHLHFFPKKYQIQEKIISTASLEQKKNKRKNITKILIEIVTLLYYTENFKFLIEKFK